ncbi:hypothetical protein H4217_006068 [Coemansia sp. RSA 1939]|nr:hypothetical protein H4217_006068 [Coemansia sp. RSA 1939]KAJ2606790.1 hypothetical protein EV177_005851 [Coemansia sp. RSA 1804]
MVDGKEDDINKLPTYTFDRSQAFATLPEARIPIDKVTRRIFTKAGVLSEWLAWISPKLRGRIQSKIVKRQKAQPHLFHFSQKTFELLKTELKEHVPESCNITISHILLALVTETLVQAHAAVASRKSKNFLKYIKPRAKKDTLPMGIIFQTREQLKLASTEYIGNVLMPKIVLKPLCEMESSTTIESLAKGIIGFSKTVSAISAPLVASYMDMIGSRPSSFTRPAMNFSFHKTAMTFVYDVMPDMYVADFGYGRPVWVSPIEPFRANAVLLLTGSNPNDGVDIFLSTFSEAMDEILKNESWMSIVSKIY